MFQLQIFGKLGVWQEKKNTGDKIANFPKCDIPSYTYFPPVSPLAVVVTSFFIQSIAVMRYPFIHLYLLFYCCYSFPPKCCSHYSPLIYFCIPIWFIVVVPFFVQSNAAVRDPSIHLNQVVDPFYHCVSFFIVVASFFISKQLYAQSKHLIW